MSSQGEISLYGAVKRLRSSSSRRNTRGRDGPGRATSARSADSFRRGKGRSKKVKN